MSFSNIQITLASAVAQSGTFNVSYPKGKNRGNFFGGVGHTLINGHNDLYTVDKGDFKLTFNTANVTVTWLNPSTLAASSKVILQLEEQGMRVYRDKDSGRDMANSFESKVMLMNLGAPIALDPNAFIVAATGAELPSAATITYVFAANASVSPVDGANQTGILDVPRNITITVTHATSIVAMSAQIVGKDVYGKALIENLIVPATGTTVTVSGKKSFKEITSIAFIAASNASTNTVDVGFGDALGLPAYLPSAGYILKELENGVVATAGVVATGDQTAPAASTGDVRGTYNPSSACNGALTFSLITVVPDPGYHGVNQFNG